MELRITAVPTCASTLPTQCCKVAGLLPDMPPCSEGRAMSKSTCRSQKGRGSAPGPRSHAESMTTGVAGKHGLSPLTRPSKVPHLTDHPPPNTAVTSLYLLSGISTDHAYEYVEQCGGSRAALCPCRLWNESCGAFVIWSASEMKISFCWLWICLGLEENRGSVWSKNGKRVTIFSRKHFSGGEREQAQLEFKCSSCRLFPCF